MLALQGQDIAILQKSVQFCGKTISKSKKRVRWVIRHKQQLHEVNCSISFYSGKKRVDHNGFKIMDIVDAQEAVSFMVFIGHQRVLFIVDDRTEVVKLEKEQQKNENAFGSFKNVFSGAIRPVFEEIFGQ